MATGKKFTDRLIQSLKPTEKRYEVWEAGGLEGFGMMVYPSGKKSFFYRYHLDGKRNFYTLGNSPYPDTTAKGRTRAAA